MVNESRGYVGSGSTGTGSPLAKTARGCEAKSLGK